MAYAPTTTSQRRSDVACARYHLGRPRSPSRRIAERDRTGKEPACKLGRSEAARRTVQPSSPPSSEKPVRRSRELPRNNIDLQLGAEPNPGVALRSATKLAAKRFQSHGSPPAPYQPKLGTGSYDAENSPGRSLRIRPSPTASVGRDLAQPRTHRKARALS